MPLLTCFVCPKKKTDRYAHIGGMDATSNVLCGQLFGIKVSEKKTLKKKPKKNHQNSSWSVLWDYGISNSEKASP
jgi:hypothetical protein